MRFGFAELEASMLRTERSRVRSGNMTTSPTYTLGVSVRRAVAGQAA
jgi:hypothetical protein